MNSRAPILPAGLHESLQTLAAHFSAVSGLSCAAVDADAQPLIASFTASFPAAFPASFNAPFPTSFNAPFPTDTDHDDEPSPPNPGCGFCRLANARKPASPCDGVSVHRYGISQANRFGGSFVYFCPANLVHWAAPVLVDGQVVGALVAGSVLMNDPEDYLSEEMGTSPATDELDRLRQHFKAIPYVPPARVTSLAKVLGDMAFSLSQKFANNALWETHVEGQQARISEYIHQLKIDNETVKRPDYPLAKERALLSLIAQGDHSNANQLLNELLGFILFASGRDMGLTKARILELVVLMSRAALEGGASVDAILKLNNSFLTQVQKSTSIEDLSVSLSAMLKRFAECVFARTPTRHAELMHKAVQYLHVHYARRIDLQTVADHFHLSATHFSKVFKEEMGQGFVQALNQIRIKRSQDLLRDPSVSLAAIAELVGFDDQSYFTKVFKKHAGMSPGQYRKNRGQAPDTHLVIRETAQRVSIPGRIPARPT